MRSTMFFASSEESMRDIFLVALDVAVVSVWGIEEEERDDEDNVADGFEVVLEASAIFPS